MEINERFECLTEVMKSKFIAILFYAPRRNFPSLSSSHINLLKTHCSDFGKDCGIFTGICCGNLVCKDFRCQFKGI